MISLQEKSAGFDHCAPNWGEYPGFPLCSQIVLCSTERTHYNALSFTIFALFRKGMCSNMLVCLFNAEWNECKQTEMDF